MRKMQPHYTKIKRKKKGICNICKKTKLLTWDHVPPKGGIDITPVQIDLVFNKIIKYQSLTKSTISQDGFKFRTICRSCNEIFGQKYDPTLNKFNRTLSNYLLSNLILPKIINIKTKPSLLVRAILGHLLAAKIEFDKIDFYEEIRKFLLNGTKNIPKNIKIFYWIYPFESHLILRDFTMPSLRNITSTHEIFNLVKHFPIAFLITKLEQYENLPELTQYCTNDISDEADIPLSIKNTHDWDWPEAISPSNFLIFGQAGINSVRGKPYKKKIDK